jgi:hypothetical protein
MLEQYERLQSSEEFQNWKGKNPEFYLAHIMIINEGDCQIGFCDRTGEKMTTFNMEDSGIIVKEGEEVFKEPGIKIAKLDITKVRISFEEALEKAGKTQQEKYKNHGIAKKIVILQKLAIGQVYNITFVTNTFHTLNMKVDSSSGEIIEEKLNSLFEMMQEYKPEDKTDYIPEDKTDYIPEDKKDTGYIG